MSKVSPPDSQVDDVLSSEQVEFTLNGYPVSVRLTTGVVAQSESVFDCVVEFSGTVSITTSSENPTLTKCIRETKLRHNRPARYRQVCSAIGRPYPGSVEQFFLDCMRDLTAIAGFSVESVEVLHAFDELITGLIDSNAFNTHDASRNWKPYCRLWADRRWLDSHTKS